MLLIDYIRLNCKSFADLKYMFCHKLLASIVFFSKHINVVKYLLFQVFVPLIISSSQFLCYVSCISCLSHFVGHTSTS